MKITVKLFATFREYLPKDAINAAFGTELEEERTVQELIKTLNLPEEIPKIVLVNGRQTEEDLALHEGDTVSIFPPLAGGY
ncbi:MAG: MoaD/ThiS family protein [Nitrospinae bacterium]|nr:MoaD/ThiS family protein [Nitrospinota bacterium]